MARCLMVNAAGMSIREIKSVDLVNRTAIVHPYGTPQQQAQEIPIKLSHIRLNGSIDEVREWFKKYLQETL